MSLRIKTFLILLFVVALYGVLGFCIQSWVILPSFRALERDEAAEDLARCTSAIQREVDYLNDFCHDWSAWDDLYAYVADPKAGFEEANLVINTFTESRLNLIYILNNAGQVVWCKIYNLDTNAPMDMEEFPAKVWAATHPLLQHHDPMGSISGVLLTRQGPMLVASRPIATTASQGPLRGTLIMGRFLDAARVKALGDQVVTRMRVYPLQPGMLPPEDAGLVDGLTRESPYHVHEESDSILQVCTLFPGIYGDPALLVRAEVVRDIMAKGWTAIHMALASIVASGLLLLVVMLMLLGSTVIRPIRFLTRHVTNITRGDELTLAPVPPRNDEIGLLAREFNHMVRRIQKDNSERKRAEAALRDSETRIRTIVETAPDGIVTVEETGIIESFNPAAERLFGYPAADIIGKSLSELMPDGYRESTSPGAERPPVPPSGMEGIGRRKDGGSFPLYWTVSEACIGDRRLFTGIVRDVTELKQMHERVLRTEHLATIGEMGASVAHEVRNPLAGISGVVQVLRKKFDEGDERRALMDEILEQIGRVDAIVGRLLMFAKLWNPQKQIVEVRALATKMTQEAQLQEPWHTIQFVLEDGPPVHAPIDPGFVEQVLWNVLRNAADAIRSVSAETARGRGEIRWGFAQTDHEARIIIEDTGPGMSTEVQEKLFRPFFTTKTYGTGLGLTICRRIMESHGGGITVHSVPGHGTTVTLEFPKGT